MLVKFEGAYWRGGEFERGLKREKAVNYIIILSLVSISITLETKRDCPFMSNLAADIFIQKPICVKAIVRVCLYEEKHFTCQTRS